MFLTKLVISNNTNYMIKLRKKSTLSEQFQIPIEQSQKEAKWTPLVHKYIPDHFPGLLHGLQKTVAEFNFLFY